MVSDSIVEATVNGQNVKGTWDILYSQALLVALDNGQRFVANLRHEPRDLYDFSDVRSHDTHKFNMKCDQTMVGFVQKINGKGTGKDTSI